MQFYRPICELNALGKDGLCVENVHSCMHFCCMRAYRLNVRGVYLGTNMKSNYYV